MGRGQHKKTIKNQGNSVDADHRARDVDFELFTTHDSSPGSPLFHPNGAHVFQKLQSFLRAQYPAFGFREVVTPTIYKDSLWKQSGHWDNYRDDMFSVSSRRPRKQTAVREGADVTLSTPQHPISDQQPGPCTHKDDVETGEYGLKPMNCPGHCLLFKSRKLSYRELPVRYADFSPLHRNEVSGSLSGLTRVRRFHQDDGHIFCRPSQVQAEIENQLKFIDTVYKVFGMKVDMVLLSTRPSDGQFIGTNEEWDLAENQLREALEKLGTNWKTNEGDGAFYGPKIDVILKDSNSKAHQTATIQLDFQLPRRFGLEYEAPAPEQERKGLETTDPLQLEQKGMITPVMIHRAVLGSFERFMALLIEHHKGLWPFWLSPRQVIILAIGDKPAVINYVQQLQKVFSAPESFSKKTQPLNAPQFQVDVDLRSETIAKKIVSAHKQKYNIICFIGEKNVKGKMIDMSLGGIPDQRKALATLEQIKPGSRAPVQKDVPTGRYRDIPGVRLDEAQLKAFMMRLTENWL